MSPSKKLNQTLQRAKFCKWIAERMVDKTFSIVDKQGGWFHPDDLDHLKKLDTIIHTSESVITDFKKFKQTTDDKAEQITNWWKIYGNIPEVA